MGTLLFLKILYPSETLYNVCFCSLFKDTVPCDIFLNLQRVADLPSAHTSCLPNSPPFIHLLIYDSFPTERHSGYWNIYIFFWIFRSDLFGCIELPFTTTDRQTDRPGTFQQNYLFILWWRTNVFLSLTWTNTV